MEIEKGSVYTVVRECNIAHVDNVPLTLYPGDKLEFTGYVTSEGYEFLKEGQPIKIDCPNEMLEVLEGYEYYLSCIDEDVEFECLESESNPMLDPIDEGRVITFGGKTYPKFGWAVVMAGGSGSGKGFVIGNRLTLDAKIFDVDALKKQYAKAKSKNGETFDFKDPETVGKLHQIVKAKGFKDKSEKAFYSTAMGAKEEGRLPNVIYDITGDDASKLKNIGEMLSHMGYKVALVWVVTNREWAMFRNLSRARVVPEKILHEVHNAVNKNVLAYINGPDAKYYDEAWIVFASKPTLQFAEDSKTEERARAERAAKGLENDCVKLDKKGSSFDVPKDLLERLTALLGPAETNPEKPEVYKSMEEVKKEIEPMLAKKKDGTSTYRQSKEHNLNGMSFRRVADGVEMDGGKETPLGTMIKEGWRGTRVPYIDAEEDGSID